MRACLAIAIASLTITGCAADVQTSAVRWDPPARACRATNAEPRFGSCMQGPEDAANTYAVLLYRRPEVDLEGGCLQCSRGECELVSTTCRCGPEVQGLEAFGDALSGLTLGELAPVGSYCVTVASLYVEGNTTGAPGECPETFACEGLLDAERGLAEAGVRSCSASFWANFPGELEISRHICRDDPDPTPAMTSPNIAGCLGIPRPCL